MGGFGAALAGTGTGGGVAAGTGAAGIGTGMAAGSTGGMVAGTAAGAETAAAFQAASAANAVKPMIAASPAGGAAQTGVGEAFRNAPGVDAAETTLWDKAAESAKNVGRKFEEQAGVVRDGSGKVDKQKSAENIAYNAAKQLLSGGGGVRDTNDPHAFMAQQMQLAQSLRMDK